MPLSHQICNEDEHMIFLWTVTESLEELQIAYKNVYGDQKSIPDFKNDFRLKEWIASRLLCSKMLDKPVQIDYLREGCPVLTQSDWSVSISHSKEMVGVQLLKSKPAGIDIERKTEKIRRISRKFASHNEIINIGDDLRGLYKIWCAKEVLFKIYQKGSLDFINHLGVFEKEDLLYGEIKKDGNPAVYPLAVMEFDNYILVFHKPQ